jgi:hypothetical protein
MNARKLVLTAGMAVAIGAPAAQPAGAMLPGDGGGTPRVTAKLPAVKKTGPYRTTSKAGTYTNHWAYVHGVVPAKAAKALGKKKTAPASTKHGTAAVPANGGTIIVDRFLPAAPAAWTQSTGQAGSTAAPDTTYSVGDDC